MFRFSCILIVVGVLLVLNQVSTSSQELLIEDIRNKWIQYERASQPFVYEIIDYRDGIMDERQRISRKESFYLRNSFHGTKEEISGVNNSYFFKVSRLNGSDQFALNSAIAIAEHFGGSLKAEASRDASLTPPELKVFLNLSLIDVFSETWAQIINIEKSTDGSLIVVDFELQKIHPTNVNGITLKHGKAFFRNDRFCLPEKINFIPTTGSNPNNKTISVSVTNMYDETGPIPRLKKQNLIYSDGFVWEKTFSYLDETLTDQDFTLSAFKLPEPKFAIQKISRVLILFGILSVAVAGAILWFLFFRKR